MIFRPSSHFLLFLGAALLFLTIFFFSIFCLNHAPFPVATLYFIGYPAILTPSLFIPV
jgi:hypothetical protein